MLLLCRVLLLRYALLRCALLRCALLRCALLRCALLRRVCKVFTELVCRNLLGCLQEEDMRIS